MKGQNIPEDAEVRIVLATLSSDGQLLPRGKEFINAVIDRFAFWVESHNVPVYLGGFGSLEWTITQELGGAQWVSDVLETSVARGIHYNYHSYHESGAFGLFGNDATTPVSMESVNRRLLNLFIEKQNGSLVQRFGSKSTYTSPFALSVSKGDCGSTRSPRTVCSFLRNAVLALLNTQNAMDGQQGSVSTGTTIQDLDQGAQRRRMVRV